MEVQEENSVLMMQSLSINNTEHQLSFSEEKKQLQNNIEDETQLNVKPFNESVQLVEKDELLEKYRNENKLLKGRLKGYETLASLYAQSKLINSQLRAQCKEQRTLLQQHQIDRRVPSTFHVHSTETSRGDHETERHFDSFEMIGSSVSDQKNQSLSPVEIARPLRNGFKEEDSIQRQIKEYSEAGGADGEAEKPSKASEPLSEIPFLKSTVDEGCSTDEDGGRCLEQNEADSRPFEIMELNAFERYLKDADSSNESKDLLMELLTFGMKIIGLERRFSEAEDKEYNSSSVKMSAHQVCKQITSCLKPGSPTKVSTTQTGDVEGNVASNANDLTRQLLPGDVGCLLNEIQILQSQALTFKNDFERERKDLEKIRSKYESMKKQYNRLTAEYSLHKGQLRDLQLGQARKKESALNQLMKTAATKPSAFQPSVGLCRLRPNPLYPPPPDWLCIRCTFENSHPGKICEMCGLDRSRLKKKGR